MILKPNLRPILCGFPLWGRAAPAPQGVTSARVLYCGVWHQYASGGSFGCCGFWNGPPCIRIAALWCILWLILISLVMHLYCTHSSGQLKNIFPSLRPQIYTIQLNVRVILYICSSHSASSFLWNEYIKSLLCHFNIQLKTGQHSYY